VIHAGAVVAYLIVRKLRCVIQTISTSPISAVPPSISIPLPRGQGQGFHRGVSSFSQGKGEMKTEHRKYSNGKGWSSSSLSTDVDQARRKWMTFSIGRFLVFKNDKICPLSYWSRRRIAACRACRGPALGIVNLNRIIKEIA
jgi:hypothetical protein